MNEILETEEPREEHGNSYFRHLRYESQSISNASYLFSSPLLFKKTQIQLHSLKTTSLTINL